MSQIQVSLDNQPFEKKPSPEEVSKIVTRIGMSTKSLSINDIKRFASLVGNKGYSFSPATFKYGKKNKENFEQQQFFALDFDNSSPDKTVSFDEIKARADYYELPLLFAYETLSSERRHNKFRVVFLNDASISDRKVAEAMQLALGKIFSEADPSCYKDVSRLYFGGKKLLYFNENSPNINIESLFRNLTHYFKDKYKANHYKEKLLKFSQKTGIAIDKKGLLDVMVSDHPTEQAGAKHSSKNGKNSPNPIIYTLNQSNIIANGEIFPNKYYSIRFIDGTNGSSVGRSVLGTDLPDKEYINHKPYRSSTLSDMSQGCRLFRDFHCGNRDMSHDELFGLATNIIQIENGIAKFQKIQNEYPIFYDVERKNKWTNDLFYIKQKGYKPQGCEAYCPYCKQCDHGSNILSTVHPTRKTMEKIPGYQEELYPLEDVQKDVYQAIYNAYASNDYRIHIIKAMTSIGKTTSYIKLMSENPYSRFLIAAPTNLLKDEIYDRATKQGLNVFKTPSLEPIMDEIPDKIQKKIRKYYRSGKHDLVHPFIYKTLEHSKVQNEPIPCLEAYLKEREALQAFKGSMITTHRYLLNMDENRLREYDAVIIDEDILLKSVMPNHESIPISKLKKLLKKSPDGCLAAKIEELLKLAKTQSCIELDSFKWSNEDDDKLYPFDVFSFCLNKRFYVRQASKERNLEEDTVVFVKPSTFKNIKYIMVSATADEDICQMYFGKDRVDFYECRNAKYEGTLTQYSQKSMSRTSIKNNPGIIRRLMERFHISEDKVITFMCENIGTLHFGNTEGSNTLEGQDILVIGTPYHADFLYKLIAFEMGLDFDEEEEMGLQTVTHNGYRFQFTTFKDEGLRAIQFWMIESELEQAVGRARLLRNSCNVHLFSNFPLKQSKIITEFNFDKE